MGNSRSEYLVRKYCSIQWARYVTLVMPGDGFSKPDRQAFVRGIDAAVNEELARLLGYPTAAAIPPRARAEFSLPENKGGLNICTLASIAPIAYVASVAHAGALLEAHAPDLHDHLLRSLLMETPSASWRRSRSRANTTTGTAAPNAAASHLSSCRLTRSSC